MQITRIKPPMYYIVGTETILNEYELRELAYEVGIGIREGGIEIGSLNHLIDPENVNDSDYSHIVTIKSNGKFQGSLKSVGLLNRISMGYYYNENIRRQATSVDIEGRTSTTDSTIGGVETLNTGTSEYNIYSAPTLRSSGIWNTLGNSTDDATNPTF